MEREETAEGLGDAALTGDAARVLARAVETDATAAVRRARISSKRDCVDVVGVLEDVAVAVLVCGVPAGVLAGVRAVADEVVLRGDGDVIVVVVLAAAADDRGANNSLFNLI